MNYGAEVEGSKKKLASFRLKLYVFENSMFFYIIIYSTVYNYNLAF